MRLEVAPGVFAEVPEAQAKEVLADLKSQREANPLLGYFPHERQKPFHAAKTRIKGIIGGNRSGKSVAGAVDDLIQALPEDWVPEHLRAYKKWHPPFYGRVITPDLGSTMQAVLDALKEWTPPSQLEGGSWDSAYRIDKRQLTLACGSRFDFMSYETDLDKFGGVARHRIRYDEEPPGEKGRRIRLAGLQRLRDYQGDEVWTLTPEFGLSWLHEDIWEHKGPEVAERVWENDRMVLVRAATFDNPHVPPDEDADEAMTEEEYRVKVLGEFFHIKGLVFDEFDIKRHVVPKPEVKHVQNLQTIVGIDPGYRTTGVSFIGFDKDNMALVYDELYLHKEAALPEATAEQIRMKLAQWKVKHPRFVIDPVARNASLQTGHENIESAYHRAGVPVVSGNNKVEAGILEVKRRLQSKQSALLVASHCQNWLKERGSYRMDDREDGAFAVVKQNDHLMDATRYVLMERTWWQPPTAKHPKKATFGENPNFEPPYNPKDLIPPDQSPLGTYT